MIKMQISIPTILAIVLSVSVGLSDDRGIRVRESRLALVIGNADYKSSPLKNPVNDARDFSNALKHLGLRSSTGKMPAKGYSRRPFVILETAFTNWEGSVYSITQATGFR